MPARSGVVSEESIAFAPSRASGPTIDVALSALPVAFSGPVITGLLLLLPSAFAGPVVDTVLNLAPLTPFPDYQSVVNATTPYHMASQQDIQLLNSINGLTLVESLSIELYVAPVTKSAIITSVVLECTDAMTIVTPPSVSVNVAGTTILPSSPLVGFDAPNKLWQWPFPLGVAVVAAPTETVVLSIDVASAAISHGFNVRVYGYLV